MRSGDNWFSVKSLLLSVLYTDILLEYCFMPVLIGTVRQQWRPFQACLIDRDLEHWAFVFLLSLLKLLIYPQCANTEREDWPASSLSLSVCVWGREDMLHWLHLILSCWLWASWETSCYLYSLQSLSIGIALSAITAFIGSLYSAVDWIHSYLSILSRCLWFQRCLLYNPHWCWYLSF